VKGMTLNILFLTITIKRRKKSKEEIMHDQFVEKLFEDHYDRQFTKNQGF
jgi:uncharacterized protein (TIGR02413 family)